MDNYKLSEVKNIIDNNLLTPEVLETILKSSTRRVDNYDDKEAIEILEFLTKEKTIPKSTKEQIEKYLAEYNTNKIEDSTNEEIKKINPKKLTILYVVVILALIIFVILLYLNGRH